MQPPSAARLLGYAGLIPFVGLAGVAAVAEPAIAAEAARGAIYYGVAILSFMGGCRWGFASAGLGEGPTFAPLAISVAPALLAWVGLWLSEDAGPAWTATLLIGGFLALYADDVRAQAARAAPAWWTSLRAPLTIGATASLAVIGATAQGVSV